MDVQASDTIEEAVARGAALLDETHPGWAGNINLETLSLASPCLCVLGQLSRQHYNRILGELSGTGDDGDDRAERKNFATAYGFDFPHEWNASYGDLQDLWVEEILSRR